MDTWQDKSPYAEVNPDRNIVLFPNSTEKNAWDRVRKSLNVYKLNGEVDMVASRWLSNQYT